MYDVAQWATRLRIAQRALPQLLGLVGLNAAAISKNVAGSHPVLAAVLAGGKYPSLSLGLDVVAGSPVSEFASWEIWAAKAIYWYIVPIVQFLLGIFIVDTWQYFLHRAMHNNKWLYTTFHSRHHRLYVPYAFGALYNHPFEGFLLDTLGASIAYKIAGMTARQGMVFFTCSTIKTVDDHCGYSLPWDPLQHITSNNAGYHDIHHQSWGIKTNFSQPFFTIWDKLLGTMWKGDTKERYQKSREAAQLLVDADEAKLHQS
jgi:sphinganine C4-monooxygenase